MIKIRFNDRMAKRKAVAFLLGRFSFKSFKTGVMLVPERALEYLTAEGIPFEIEGPATYEDQIPALRDFASAGV